MRLRIRSLAAALVVIPLTLSTAHAGLIVPPSTPKSFSGYDGEPATITGVLTSGIQGTLRSTGPGVAAFTYLGNESKDTNQFYFSVGSQYLTESSALGTTILGSIGSGPLSFNFRDTTLGHVFGNGSYAIVYVPNVSTSAYGTFDYVLGFNDKGSSDGDFDDFVVGVKFRAVPEPGTLALLGLGLLGLGVTGRRRKA